MIGFVNQDYPWSVDMTATTEIMYMYVIAHTNKDDDYVSVRTIRMYCTKPSWNTTLFMYSDTLMQEVAKSNWERIFDSIYHEANWEVSHPERVLVNVKETKKYRKYYDIYGGLMHTEKLQ